MNNAELKTKSFTAYTVHCSHCDTPVLGEHEYPVWYDDESMADESWWDWASESGWERDVDGRALVCDECCGWYCECDELIRAWTTDHTCKETDV